MKDFTVIARVAWIVNYFTNQLLLGRKKAGVRYMQTSFYTIKGASEALYKELGSKFLAFAYPVNNEAEVKANLEGLKKKYFDASHHCYAWMLGASGDRFRAFDDGEPNHSAGDPILGQIRSKSLTNILIVVVRYFGGTKLGVGGLVKAYKTASAAALMAAEIVERTITKSYSITYAYESTPEVMSLVKEFDLSIEAQEFSEGGFMRVSVAVQRESDFLKRIELAKALGHSISIKVIINTQIN